MTTQNQPLDHQPQDSEDDFDAAFEEFAGKGRETEPDTAKDFEGGESDQGDGDPHEDESGDRTSSEESGEDEEGAGDELATRLQALEEENQRLKHSDLSQRGRLGAYQKQINELQRQLKTVQPSQPAGQASESDTQKKQDAAEALGLEDWESLKNDFPDVARAVEARLAADRQAMAQYEQRLDQLQAAVEPIQQQAQVEHLKVQEDALTARHPDWREVVAAPEFAEWLNQQPTSLQQLTASNDAAEAAALLDVYRAQTGRPPEPAVSREGTPDRRQERLAAAQTVGRRGAPRTGQVADDFDAAFDHYAAKKAVR